MAERFDSGWMSTVIVGARGRERLRSKDYLGPTCFVGEASLTCLKDALDHRDPETVVDCSEEALEHTGGDLARDPEAPYWTAVSTY